MLPFAIVFALYCLLSLALTLTAITYILRDFSYRLLQHTLHMRDYVDKSAATAWG